jgi:hypothetical protein
MGIFSWKTADTNESIPVVGNEEREVFTVYLLCPDGTKLKEDAYEGYGIFNGEDVYQLFAQWNCPELCEGNVKTDRDIGIDFEAKYPEKIKYPIKIVENPNLDYDEVQPSEECEYKGYFYTVEDSMEGFLRAILGEPY